MASPERRKHAADIGKRLKRAIPQPQIELDFADAWQLLVATILSAQSTDKTINRVTPILFRRWPTPADLAGAPVSEIEAVVKPTGFFRNKAKAIRGAAEAIVARHGGEVPRTMAELIELPGVARKTANVVLGGAFGISAGMAVDTHVGRVSRRLGLTREEDPVKVETDLMELFPRKEWYAVNHRLLLHGRYVCLSKRPRCAACPLNELCPSRETAAAGRWTDRAATEQALVEARGELHTE